MGPPPTSRRSPRNRSISARRATTEVGAESFRRHTGYIARSVPAITFICPQCGFRSVQRDRVAGLRGKGLSCERCGAGMLFELLDDYYPAPAAAMFVTDKQGR